MKLDPRRIAVGLAGFCAFLNLYAPQAVLPLLAQEFSAGAGKASLAVTASTLAIALIAPFTGVVADVLGRKRVIIAAMFALIVPTAMAAFAADLDGLIFWRFVQGLVLPPVFAVTVAYIGEEWPRAQAIGVTGIYLSATGLGGFFGRFVTGLVADLLDWRSAFLVLAAMTAALAVGVALLLPKEQHFDRSDGLGASARQMVRHLKNPHLVATYAIGSGVLFNFVAIFTYVSFHLAAPPFGLSPTFLGAIFVVYLVGAAVTPLTGRMVARFGRRPLMLGVLAMWAGGLLLSLVPSLPVIVVALAVCATCGFLCQTMSTSFVAVSADAGHSSAVGLYVTFYYIGGTFGGLLPAPAWEAAGWPGCVAIVIAALILMAALVMFGWRGKQ